VDLLGVAQKMVLYLGNTRGGAAAAWSAGGEVTNLAHRNQRKPSSA
jgi:hypothetical protein